MTEHPKRMGRSRPPVPHGAYSRADLAERKRAAATTVSVIVPALDEEAGVGGVVATMCAAGHDLVDEVLVVDGGSADATIERARSAGARVVRQADVLPEAGDRPGKGEAMWKGLAASKGELVVFVDADVADIGQRFVTGLLGPLLTDPGVSFVKAAYDRPLVLGDVTAPTGGGRVTELLARPLLATFWPQLADVVQPLAGEIAARRSLLERLPFAAGYGVELAMLIDVAAAVGAEAIAQVDLERREHDHQPLDALGRMAGEVLHVARRRLIASGRLVEEDDGPVALVQPWRGHDGRFAGVSCVVGGPDRPPLR